MHLEDDAFRGCLWRYILWLCPEDVSRVSYLVLAVSWIHHEPVRSPLVQQHLLVQLQHRKGRLFLKVRYVPWNKQQFKKNTIKNRPCMSRENVCCRMRREYVKGMSNLHHSVCYSCIVSCVDDILLCRKIAIIIRWYYKISIVTLKILIPIPLMQCGYKQPGTEIGAAQRVITRRDDLRSSLVDCSCNDGY